MGLSFHYSGSIASPELLPELIDEIEDIVSVFKWEYKVYERNFPENAFGKPGYNPNIYGICFTPPNCETVDLSFLSNGRMSNALHLHFYGKTGIQTESDLLYMLSVKTQHAGFETHQLVIQLFRYLNAKYFADFKLYDEGQYWETNDELLLQATFKRYADLINGFTSALENYPMRVGEEFESYFLRLIRLLNKQKK